MLERGEEVEEKRCKQVEGWGGVRGGGGGEMHKR